jgi:type I restriction enzyme S subunit
MWKTVKLGDVCDVLDSLRKPITKKFRSEGNYPYYGATGIVDWIDNYIFDEKLVLVGEDGAKWGVGDRTAFIAEGKYWVNNHAHVLRPHANIITHEWIAYYLTAIDLKDWVTGLTVPKLNQAQMRSIPIPLPPLAEQQRIVAKLDAAFAEIDRAAALTESKLTEAKNLLDASIAKIFDDNLIGADYFVLDDVVTRLTNGYVGATKNIYQEEGIPYLLARHVKNNTLKFDGKTFVSNEFNVKNKKSILKQDDVLLVQSGHIGHTAVVPMEHEGHNCHAMIVISTVKEALTGEYLSALFNSREYKAKLLSLRTGSTVPHLNCGDVNKVKIPIPNMKTQETIISLTKSATASFAAMEVSLLSKSSGLKKLKSAILAQELQPPHSEAA